MAIKTVSIGTAEDVYRFDDGVTPYGVETDAQIKVGTAPALNDEVVRLQDIPAPGDGVSATANIADNAIVRGDGGVKKVQDSPVTIDDAGNVDIPTGQGLQVNSTQVVTDQQLAEANAAAISAVTVTAGAQTIDIAATDVTLAILVTEINALRTTVNNLLAKLRTHGLIDT